jgi:uncharacterized membrane protein YbhN (UPF0104 family)
MSTTSSELPADQLNRRAVRHEGSFVSHLTPFGSATGTLVNASALESEGVAAATTGEAIGLTSLMSTLALIVLFGTGFVATSGRHVSHQYLVIAGIALFGVVAALAAVLAVGSHPAIAGRAGRWAATVARHVRPGIDPAKVGQASSAPRATAVLAVLGYRIVNYWLPLIPGAIAYIRLRLRSATAGSRESSTPSAR